MEGSKGSNATIAKSLAKRETVMRLPPRRGQIKRKVVSAVLYGIKVFFSKCAGARVHGSSY